MCHSARDRLKEALVATYAGHCTSHFLQVSAGRAYWSLKEVTRYDVWWSLSKIISFLYLLFWVGDDFWRVQNATGIWPHNSSVFALLRGHTESAVLIQIMHKLCKSTICIWRHVHIYMILSWVSTKCQCNVYTSTSFSSQLKWRTGLYFPLSRFI